MKIFNDEKIMGNDLLSVVFEILQKHIDYNIGILDVKYTPENDILVDLSGGKAAVVSANNNTINIDGDVDYCNLLQKIIQKSL